MNSSVILYHLPCFFSHIDNIDMIDDVTKDLDNCYGDFVCMEIKALGLQNLKSFEQNAIDYYTSLDSSYNAKIEYLTGATTAVQGLVDGWSKYKNFKIGTSSDKAQSYMEKLCDKAVKSGKITSADGLELKERVSHAMAGTFWSSNTYADLESSLKSDIVSKTIKKENISVKKKEASAMGTYLKAEFNAEYTGIKK